MGKKNCVICGKEGYSYFPFCYEHLQEKNAGKIVKCDCGTWHYADQPCKNCEQEVQVNSQDLDEATANTATNDLTCIICGEPSNGKHFCKKCYAKYKDHSIDIRITHCTETAILDEYGNQTYKCDNGIKVRSRAEKIIADFLFKENIRAVYEKTIYCDDGTELHPDFYLPDSKLYIEYNERKDKPYLTKKEYAKQKYEQLGLKVVIMTEKDLEDVEAFIKPLLGLH